MGSHKQNVKRSDSEPSYQEKESRKEQSTEQLRPVPATSRQLEGRTVWQTE